MDLEKANVYADEIQQRIQTVHIGCFKGMEKPLFLISKEYPGIWLEHVYDSVFYATINPKYAYLAKNTIEVFLNSQTEEGQFPCYIWDGNRMHIPEEKLKGYGQIQECVSFMGLCLRFCKMTHDLKLMSRCYKAGCRWVSWLCKYRMTRGEGLVEMFVGYDTGHDESSRLNGMAYYRDYRVDGKIMNASVLPPEDGISPIITVDMNANFYGTLKALSEMAAVLGDTSAAAKWEAKAKEHKEKFFKLCLDPDTAWFFDVDKNGNKRPYRSSTILHLFMEHVLDPKTDRELINRIYGEHIKNPNEFWTPYPFPSMAADDPSTKGHRDRNCWGYFSQGLIALRCTLWMDDYGFSEDFDHICKKWVEAWTDCYDQLKFGQEIDPFTGKPSPCSEWYSSTMLFYLYAVKRLSKK